MKYHTKGGTWRNVEDEILKAAVMKYGLNQWARISSLLVRKSAKQCKERWYEWLDPKIKKTQWTAEEEKRLVELVEQLPCQWHTIAPMMNRTVFQCVEQFQKILDRKEKGEKEGGERVNSSSIRLLKQGETDPNPEAKPARPDPIDLDEDLKDMLNEARARIANRRGKKANRKLREKQMEQAKRLANLQKKRELREVGVEGKEGKEGKRRKKEEINYNAEIPFRREVPKGSFTFENDPENTEKRDQNKEKANVNLFYLEGRDRDVKELKRRKEDIRNLRKMKEHNLEKVLEEVNKKYNSAHEADRETGIPFTNICKVCRRERKTAGGYYWSYMNEPIKSIKTITKHYTPVI